MKKIIFFLQILFFLVICCDRQTQHYKLILPDHFKFILKQTDTNKKMLIYYHSGECSFCFGILNGLSLGIPEVPIVSISASRDSVLTEFYHDNIQFRGLLLHDSDSLFYKSNHSILSKKRIILVDSNYSVLFTAKEFDNDVVELIKKHLY